MRDSNVEKSDICWLKRFADRREGQDVQQRQVRLTQLVHRAQPPAPSKSDFIPLQPSLSVDFFDIFMGSDIIDMRVDREYCESLEILRDDVVDAGFSSSARKFQKDVDGCR